MQPADDGQNALMGVRAGEPTATAHVADDGRVLVNAGRELGLAETVLAMQMLGDQIAKNLPYGQQRRIEIARALASKPKLILLDEPTAGMNPQETESAIRLFRKLRDDLGITVVLIEHDMKVVMGISEYISVIDYGQKIAEGTPDQVRKNQRVIEAYLGRSAAAEIAAHEGAN